MTSDPFDDDGECKYCGTWKGHDRDCPYHTDTPGGGAL